MTTTDQRPPRAPETPGDAADAGAERAGAGGAAGGAGAGAGAWAVPGVDHIPAQPGPTSAADARTGTAPGGAAPGEAGPEGARREGAAAAEEAAARWREDLLQATNPAPGSTRGNTPSNAGGIAVSGDSASSGAHSGAGGAHVHPVLAAVAACVSAMDSVREAGVGTLSAREIRTLLLAVTHLITTTIALKLRLLVAAETQRVADLTGATTTAAFLAHLTRIDRTDAGAQVRLAKDLHRRYPTLAAALAAGRINPAQLRVCVTALRKLPKDLPTAKLTDCQQFLIDAAQTMAPRTLKLLGRRLWHVIDPDGADARDEKDLRDEEERGRARAYFTSWRNGDGTTGFRGKLPDTQADILLKLLHAHASPRRRNNPHIPTNQPDDHRPEPEGPQPEHQRPEAPEPGPADPPHDPPEDPPGADRSCDGTPRDRCLDEPSAEEEHTGKPIPYPIRLGHALIDLLEHIPTTAIPDTGGIPATIVATLTTDQLRTGLGHATLDTGTPLSASQLRRLACTAGIIPMVLGGDSQPLDLGREQRLFNKPQRLAVAHRQHNTCATDNCDRPITAIHHPHPWSQGGPTDLHNALGLCSYHHHLAHHSHWQLTRRDDNTWTFHRH